MSTHTFVLLLHLLGATVWVGGHLMLVAVVLPPALKKRSVRRLMNFERQFERIGIPALITQVVTGVWLAADLVAPSSWFDGSPLARAVLIKLGLLLLTALLAVDARVRLIPKLKAENLVSLAFHIIPVTVVSVLFVFAGLVLRFGGV
jgi:putative copper export protein